MEFLDGQEAEELLQEYMRAAPEDVRRAWEIHEQSFNAFIAEVARLTMKVKELTTKSE